MPILEAGCGPGYLIAELKEMGFHVVGVDYEGEVVAILRESRPDFDVRVGDVRSLDLPSQSFGCYLSGGIVEHFPEGPEAALAEARRVLHPSGVAFIEVPYLNYFRAQRLARLREHRVSENDSLSFYQYYFDTREFESLLCRAGLRVVNRVRHGAETFLVREHAGFARFWGSCLCREPLKKALRRLLRSHACGIQSRLAHCEIFVCQPMPN
ncbi:MAG: methyltransferase domain-containing protein [Bryobacteraceae bacterium]|nr:methyltransferase domain-containing protein [Bryobacteraceae bacterium]